MSSILSSYGAAARFVTTALRGNGLRVEVAADSGLVTVTRNGKSPVRLAVVSVEEVTEDLAGEILSTYQDIDAIVNSGKNLHYSAAAKRLAKSIGAEIYLFRELSAAIQRTEFIGYEWGTMTFARTSLSRHSRVSEVQDVCERTLKIRRPGLADIDAVFEDQYTLGITKLHQALDWHPNVNAVINVGGYAGCTEEAREAARGMGISLFTLKEFMGALNYDGRRFTDYRSPSKGD